MAIITVPFHMWKLNKEDSGSGNSVLRLNVSGTPHELHKHFLFKRGRGTLLQKLACMTHEERMQFCDTFQEKNKVYFIWRSPAVFDSVVNFLSTGHIHGPNHICPEEFLRELEFWELDLRLVPSCCRNKLRLPEQSDILFSSPSNTASTVVEVDEIAKPVVHLQAARTENGDVSSGEPLPLMTNEFSEEDQESQDEFSVVCLGKFRRAMWNTFEDPSTGYAAKVLMAISAGFVFISVFILILGSMKEFQDINNEPIHQLMHTEYVCVTWFTFEYVTRLLLTPCRWKFLKTPLNIVDALSLFPFYLEISFLLSGKATKDLQNWKGALLAMRILRVFRVARVLKLARYSGGLKSFGSTLTHSKKEIGMLLMFLSTAMLLFSTSVYFFEKDHKNTPFTSIPATFWWAVVTMTTVGYGDMIPVSFGGKLVASFATISGVIVLAFPITLIVENFNHNYQMIQPDNCDQQRDKKRAVHVRSVAIV